ncbi:hypothetical protein OH76DRAFT_320959 [Lentinus brumalis]|uniref:Uncharacterized protein n=1 Tax=Lentinus brumalis TaxID=2498619 RepID=A0A371DFH7_9APHY|nr:hypothetical protein OH76DRAFT_320959 [Polyporus brumalis]
MSQVRQIFLAETVVEVEVLGTELTMYLTTEVDELLCGALMARCRVSHRYHDSRQEWETSAARQRMAVTATLEDLQVVLTAAPGRDQSRW